MLRVSVAGSAALLCAVSAGCGKPEAPVEQEPSDLTLDLGQGVSLCFMEIEAINLLVGKYEVTNAQYRRFNPNHSSGRHKDLSLDGGDQPVVNVSWNDAKAFCDWLTMEFGERDDKQLLFRLPTIEEWEIFARCGDDREFPWGNDWPPPESWNYFGSENIGLGPQLEADHKHPVSAPVRESGVNEWRLYGVGGNVWEWCEDIGINENDNVRVLKGASWVDSHPLFLSVDRNRLYPPDYRAVNMGFRVVATPSSQPTP